MNRLTILLFTALFLMLAAVGWFAYVGLGIGGNSAMPTHGYMP